jgi:hypothetical protein
MKLYETFLYVLLDGKRHAPKEIFNCLLTMEEWKEYPPPTYFNGLRKQAEKMGAVFDVDRVNYDGHYIIAYQLMNPEKFQYLKKDQNGI